MTKRDSVEKIHLKKYAALLSEKINKNWKISNNYTTFDVIKTTIALTIQNDGLISKINIEKKSGDVEFDLSAIKAISNSQPLPAFPAKLTNLNQLEFVLDFTPNGLM